LRIKGKSYRAIAAELGIGIRTAYTDVQRSLQQHAKMEAKLAADYLRLELHRLDVAQEAIWDKVTEGGLGAVQTFVSLSSQRSKLLALYAPTEVLVAGPDGGPVVMEVDDSGQALAEVLAILERAGVIGAPKTGGNNEQDDQALDVVAGSLEETVATNGTQEVEDDPDEPRGPETLGESTGGWI